MQLVQNDAVAYGIAFAFVADSEDKLSVFTQAFQEQHHNNVVESKSSAAAQVANARWLVMYPEVVSKA
jgi:hypothetical protein